MRSRAFLLAAILLAGSQVTTVLGAISCVGYLPAGLAMPMDYSTIRLEFLTYLGGDMEDWLRDLIVDDVGNVWVLGYTESTNMELQNPIQETYGGQGDALIARFTPQHELEFCTYFGGNGMEYAMAFDLDNEGNLVVVGSTQSSNFYILNALQTELNGTSDAFVTKINPNGTILFSTYYGGSGEDSIDDLEVDSNGNYVMVGQTSSDDLDTNASVVQPTYGGGTSDIMLLSMASDGQSILLGSYLGGDEQDTATSVRLDGDGNIGIIGFTGNNDTVTPDAFQLEYGGGPTDTLIAKLTPNLDSLLWATLLGGDGWEFGSGIRFDSQNNVIVSGYTGSSDFPLQDQILPDSGSYDAFLARLNETGSALQFSTYLGGAREDRSYGLELLSDDSVVILCNAGSSDMPIMDPLQENNAGATDAYLGVFDSTDELVFATYIGGSSSEYSMGLVVINDELIAFTGYTYSDDLPVVGPGQADRGGSSDGFLCILNMTELSIPTTTTTTTTETTNGESMDLMLVALAGVGVVALVIVIVVVRKMK